MRPDKIGLLAFVRLGTILSIVVRASVGVAHAQAFDVLHAFAGTATTGVDLAFPQASLIQASDGNFYGTTTNAGTTLNGAIFRMTPAGTVTILYTFQGSHQYGGTIAPLLQGSDGNLYGMTYSHATGQFYGMSAFSLSSEGLFTELFETSPSSPPGAGMIQAADGRIYGTYAETGVPIIFRFLPSGSQTISVPPIPYGASGVGSMSALVQAPDGNFYGTSSRGGAFDQGTVFTWNPSGLFAVLHDFAGGSDGAVPHSIIQGTDGHFYGTTEAGGSAGQGTVFQMTAGGTVTILHAFTGGTDGGAPTTPLIEASDHDFYGTTAGGGAANLGVAFKITAGGVFTTVHAFNGGGNDGAQPEAALLQAADGNLYGTTQFGGNANLGTAFMMTPLGAVTILHHFDAFDGAAPQAALLPAPPVFPDFYTTTASGGVFNLGTITKMTSAGTFSTVHAFAGGSTEGANPMGGLIFVPAPIHPLQDGTLYGTTSTGGPADAGTVFKMTLDGRVTTLHALLGGSFEGAGPQGALLQAFDNSIFGYSLIGTTTSGGFFGAGTIFRMAPDGTFTILHHFAGGPTDGAQPGAALVLATDGNLYGTTFRGGASDGGTIFRMAQDGSVVVLYAFNGGADGANPRCTLVQASDGYLYGTTSANNAVAGTAFRMTLSGALTTLHTFAGGGNDGADPQAGLMQAIDGFLYGTTASGGSFGGGTIFRMTLGGVVTTLASLAGTDAAQPAAALIANGRVMYGTTASGGASGQGTVFRLTLDGPPSPPATVSVAPAVKGRVHLTWASVATTSTYVVKRGLSPGHETVLITGLGSNSFVDATVTTGATYYYVVSAVNASGSSVASYEVSITAGRGAAADFDGDARADLTVFRPSTGTWFIRQSATLTGTSIAWGGSADRPVPGDYDGDGLTDVAIFRPSTGTWYIRYSATLTSAALAWGGANDMPVPGDYDGDGLTDLAVFRPSTGTWYIRYSATLTGAALAWGGANDVPVPGDFDGDGRADIAVFRPSNGTWYIRYSATLTSAALAWGGGSDVPVPSDYDGDGKADIAVFRPATGTWYIRYSATLTSAALPWGAADDLPVPGDFDGDGLTDIAVYSPSNGTWYIRYSATLTSDALGWGAAGDIPILKRP